MKIKGTFEVILAPLDIYTKSVDEINLGRMSINKQFFGELKARSKGEMLSVMTATKGSAGYVAIEQIVGELSGKKGSFVLQHFGVRDKGNDHMHLMVIPDSGTQELKDLRGTMTINQIDDQHHYEFDYTLGSFNE